MLTIQASWQLLAARLGLRLFPYRVMHNWATPPAAHLSHGVDAAPTRTRIIRAVLRASRYLPGESTCLPQAMAAYRLLAQRGIPARLKIGVRKEDEQKLSAHAWVECEGQVVIGGPDTHTHHYLPLTDLEELEL
jgi:hypothetical protein